MAFNLADVLKDVPNPGTGREQITYISRDLLDADENNFYKLSDLEGLAENIALCGLQQPIRVRRSGERYVIVSGHRRRAAIELLAGEDPLKWQEVACIIEADAVSPALQQLRLIYANANTRTMTSWEISQQTEQVTELLYQLKEEGYDFPGRMRDHVAQAVGISKSKISRLKVIRDNLGTCWQGFWQDGTLNESVAYNLSQLPKSWQNVIYNVWGEKPGRLSADIPARAKAEFQRLTQMECQHGLPSCDHCVTMMEKNCKEQYFSPCSGCCFDCTSLRTCRDVCPQARGKQQELKAVAKQADAEAERREKERARPFEEFAKLVWHRIGLVRSLRCVSVEDLVRARGELCYNPSYDDPRQEKMESGQGEYGRNSTLGFGYSLRACDVMKMVSVADALGCSLDYLFGRTDMMSVKRGDAAVPEVGTGWQTGEPVNLGKYMLLLDRGREETDLAGDIFDWRGDGWYQYGCLLDEEFDGKVLAWCPLPEGVDA